MPFITIIEKYVVQVLFYFILLLEIYGAAVIIFSANSVFFYFIKTSKDGQRVRLTLASYLSFGLELFLAAEILRTVISRNLEELKVLAAIIALRAIMTVLITWEIKQESKT
ncbi:MAG: DUF1622 domain-containing protein [Dethiobacter sp.]|jgi:uncharacterized membrane protein|nr:MAG: DUF1622 domain-containing protein [Dethiobacter sp.]